MPNDPSVHDFDFDDWNSPLDDHLFCFRGDDLQLQLSEQNPSLPSSVQLAIARITSTQFLRVARSRAREWAAVATETPTSEPSPAVIRDSTVRVHAAANDLLTRISGLIECLRVLRPDPARRILSEADSCNSSLANLVIELRKFGYACGGTVTLKAHVSDPRSKTPVA